MRERLIIYFLFAWFLTSPTVLSQIPTQVISSNKSRPVSFQNTELNESEEEPELEPDTVTVIPEDFTS